MSFLLLSTSICFRRSSKGDLSETFLLFEFYAGWGGPHDFSVSHRPVGTNLGFGLGWTLLGLGHRGLRTKGLGPGLDNLVSQRNFVAL